MEKQDDFQKKYHQMTETQVERLVCRMAVPTIISMMITSFYSLADTFFVGRLGTSATAAVGVAFPIMSLIQAFGFYFGQGSGNSISRKLGAGQVEDASKMAATGFFSAMIFGILFTGLGLLFLSPLTHLLGATDTIYPYAIRFLRLILLGAPFMTPSLVMNNQLRSQGNAFYAMIGLATGAILNILMDPFFIFVCKMGVEGAAVSTITSQFVSFILLLRGCSKTGMPIRLSKFSPNLSQFRQINGGGLPSLLRQGLSSVAVICLNVSAKPFGDAAIAAMSIVSRITSFSASALLGFGQGFQPVCGFNYGAKKYSRVLKAYWFTVWVSVAVLTLLGIIGFLIAPELVASFRADDPPLIQIGAMALRLQCLSFPLLGWFTPCNMMLQNIGKTWSASVLSMGRQGIFFLPGIVILPLLMGLTGVELCQPVADALTFLLSIPIGGAVLKEMKQLQKAEDEKNAAATEGRAYS